MKKKAANQQESNERFQEAQNAAMNVLKSMDYYQKGDLDSMLSKIEGDVSPEVYNMIATEMNGFSSRYIVKMSRMNVKVIDSIIGDGYVEYNGEIYKGNDCAIILLSDEIDMQEVFHEVLNSYRCKHVYAYTMVYTDDHWLVTDIEMKEKMES